MDSLGCLGPVPTHIMGDHVILLMTTLATHDLSFANQLELQQIYIEFRKMIQTQFSCSIIFFFSI